MEIADKRNAAESTSGGTAIHGVTKFSDLSQNEFEQTYLGFKLHDNDDDALNDAYYNYKTSILADGLNGDDFATALDGDLFKSSNWVSDSVTHHCTFYQLSFCSLFRWAFTLQPSKTKGPANHAGRSLRLNK